MYLFYYCNFALEECKLYKGITNYISNKYWGVQIPGSTYHMLHRFELSQCQRWRSLNHLVATCRPKMWCVKTRDSGRTVILQSLSDSIALYDVICTRTLMFIKKCPSNCSESPGVFYGRTCMMSSPVSFVICLPAARFNVSVIDFMHDLQLHLIHPSLDRRHSPPQTAPRSNQPFFHSSPTGQIDRQTDRQVG